MRIAIASSGLGHVARGIETWAEDTAVALAERAGGVRHPSACGGLAHLRHWRILRTPVAERAEVVRHPSACGGLAHLRHWRIWRTPVAERSEVSGQLAVTLFAAGETGRGETKTRQDTLSTLRPGSRQTVHRSLFTTPNVVVLPCWRRSGRLARVLARLSPGFAWRWGLKSAYGWEQLSFWWKLESELRRGDFDILHVQDPMLAYWCRRARMKGRIRTQEILAHGTEESVEFLAQFEFVQHLSPWHLEQAKRGWPEDG